MTGSTIASVEGRRRRRRFALPRRIAGGVALAREQRRFLAAQITVIAISIGHLLMEAAGLDQPIWLLLTVMLYLYPIALVSGRWGTAGATPTIAALLAIRLPADLLTYRGVELAEELLPLGFIVIFGATLARRSDREARARDRALSSAAALAVSEAKYRALFDGAADAVVVVDGALDVVDCNEAARSLIGREQDNGWSSLTDILPRETIVTIMGGRASGPVRMVAKGRERWLEPQHALLPGTGLRQIVLRDVTRERARQLGLSTYAAAVLQAQEDERRRIARELHDEVVQSLVLLSREVAELRDEVTPGAEPGVEAARDRAVEIASSVRNFARLLRPPVLDDLGLVPAIERFLRDTAAEAGFETRFAVSRRRARLSGDAELALFRIAQEAVHNVIRHGHATRVAVTLRFGASGIRLTVSDNGIGFTPPEDADQLPLQHQLGILGMVERARLAGGSIDIRSAPGAGTKVAVRLPCPGAGAADPVEPPERRPLTELLGRGEPR